MNTPSPEKKIEISILKDSEIEEVIIFYNRLYKENRDSEKFVWEFHSPNAGKAIYIIARDIVKNCIVGSQCAIPIMLTNNTGEAILTAKSEDTLVDPEYRGLSIFENMYQELFLRCKESGIRYIWGFTSAKKPFQRLGFSLPYDHSQSLMAFDTVASYRYLSGLNPKNKVSDLQKIFGLCILSRLNAIKLNSSSGLPRTFQVASTHFDASELKDHHKLIDVKSDEGFWIRQDLPYLQWRIAGNPYHEKVFVVYFKKDTELVANLMFNHHKNGVWYLLSDTYSSGLSEKEKCAIHAKAIRLLRQKEKGHVKLIRTWDFSHNAYGRDEIRRRQRVGYTHLDRGVSFVWKCLDDNDTLPADAFVLSRLASQGMI